MTKVTLTMLREQCVYITTKNDFQVALKGNKYIAIYCTNQESKMLKPHRLVHF